MHLKILSVKWRSFCPGEDELTELACQDISRHSYWQQSYTHLEAHRYQTFRIHSGLDIKHLVYLPIGYVVLKIYVPWKNVYVPNQYLYKPCKAYIYCWKNKYMPRLKNHLPSWACNHKSLCALGQNLLAQACRHALMSTPDIWLSLSKQKLLKIANKHLWGITINSMWPSHVIWWHRSGSKNTGSGNGLLPDSTKPFPEPKLVKVFCGTHLRGISQVLINIMYDDFLKNQFLKLLPHLSGVNELRNLKTKSKIQSVTAYTMITG